MEICAHLRTKCAVFQRLMLFNTDNFSAIHKMIQVIICKYHNHNNPQHRSSLL